MKTIGTDALISILPSLEADLDALVGPSNLRSRAFKSIKADHPLSVLNGIRRLCPCPSEHIGDEVDKRIERVWHEICGDSDVA